MGLVKDKLDEYDQILEIERLKTYLQPHESMPWFDRMIEHKLIIALKESAPKEQPISFI